MTRVTFFDSPLLMGLDRMEQVLKSGASAAAKTASDGYPPYNIEQTGENAVRITLAVAGFTEAGLSAAVEQDQLVIRGKQHDERERVFLHRGIAARQFQRRFALAPGTEVLGAHLDNGLLHVDLVRPESRGRVRKIEINRLSDGKTPERLDIDLDSAE